MVAYTYFITVQIRLKSFEIENNNVIKTSDEQLNKFEKRKLS